MTVSASASAPGQHLRSNDKIVLNQKFGTVINIYDEVDQIVPIEDEEEEDYGDDDQEDGEQDAAEQIGPPEAEMERKLSNVDYTKLLFSLMLSFSR